MGLDGVEMVMETEQAFGIKITDAEAERVFTPRDLIELVGRKLAITFEPTCLSRRAFLLVRRAMVEGHLATRDQVRPGTALATWLEPGPMPARWSEFRQKVGATAWPELTVPGWVHSCITGLSLAAWMTVTMVASAGFGQGISTGLWLGVFAAVATAVVAYRCLPLPRTALPPAVRSVGDLARWLVAHDPAALAAPAPWTRERTALRVREIVCNALGCETKYREDARLVQDLGLD
ncbi:MAG: acyl carrier protein [Limisphaerales bacterium]